MRVPWTARRSNQSVLKEINPEYSLEVKILVTLSCTMCPDLVVAAQRLAAANHNITAHVYDIRHFENMKNQYNVMSVPCMVINNETVSFGKKNLSQLLALLNADK